MGTVKKYRRTLAASTLQGDRVVDPQGRDVGRVEAIMLDVQTGRVAYVVLSFGGFLGIGEKFHPVPWPLLEYDVVKLGFVVPLDRSILEHAPSYDPAELRQLGGADHRSYGSAIYDYYGRYGASPYW